MIAGDEVRELRMEGGKIEEDKEDELIAGRLGLVWWFEVLCARYSR